MIAQVLDHNKDPEDILPFTHDQEPKGHEPAWSHTIDEATWRRVGQPALDMFDDFLNQLEADQEGEPATFMVEERGEFPGIPGAFGTSDVPFRCGKIGGIWDWKFGRGPVAAEDNSQLLFYFSAMLNKYPDFFDGVDRVMLCISQPLVNMQEPDVWETDLEDVRAFEDELREAIEIAKGDDAPIEAGGWCKFADCKKVCELHIGAAAKLGEKMALARAADNGETDEDGTPISETIDWGAFYSDAMELASMAEDWAKAIAGGTQAYLENGLDVPGWKLVKKRSSGRGWNPEIEEKTVVTRLRTRGLKADQYYDKKLRSPTQIEKELKPLGKTLPEELVVMKQSSGHTLTRAGDPRSEAVPPAKKAAELGSSLLQQIGKKAQQ